LSIADASGNSPHTIALTGWLQPAAGASLVRATPIAHVCQGSPLITRIAATAQGNMLVAVFQLEATNASSVSAPGAAFVPKVQVINKGHNQAYSAYNVAGGITSVSVNYAGFQCLNGGWIFEISGVPTASDPWDTASAFGNAFAATNLGTGLIRAGANGLTMAAFMDYYNAATAYSNGAGWTSGTTGTNHGYYQYRASTGGSFYGGISGQATVTGGAKSAQIDAVMFNIKSQ
jgi:hypothetical protein